MARSTALFLAVLLMVVTTFRTVDLNVFLPTRTEPGQPSRSVTTAVQNSTMRDNAPFHSSTVPNSPKSTTQQLSPACYPSFGGKKNITRIYFSHTRKAAGTTIKYFLRSVATKLGWEFESNEAYLQEHPNRMDTLYVVNIREPISRIISSYKFEGRWSCKKMMYNKSFVPSLENQKTLEQDIAHIQEDHRDFCGVVARRKYPRLWRCVGDCLTRWYTDEFGCGCLDDYTRYQAAKDRLMKYDIVVVAEYLKDTSRE
mmetsp:Transcript_22460/g.32195  ORF Transcript_22460/g.32195 Transcript_22460/m.32195 type:complete len:256 (+) Transcript_22460:213-980(+)